MCTIWPAGLAFHSEIFQGRRRVCFCSTLYLLDNILGNISMPVTILGFCIPEHNLSFPNCASSHPLLWTASQFVFQADLCLLNAYYTGMHQHIQLLLLQFWSSRALLRNCHFSSGRLVFEDFIFHLVKAKMLRLIVDSVLFLTLKVALFVTHNLPSLLHSFNVYSTEVF